MTLEQIRARLQQIQARQKEIYDASGDDGFTDEVQAEFDQLSDEFDRLIAQEARLIRFEGQQAAMSASPGRQTQSNDTAAPRIQTREAVEDDPNMGFDNLADLAMSVRAAMSPDADFDTRLRVLGAPSNFHETSGSDGYMVPPAMREEIWELAFNEESIFRAMMPEPTNGNAVDFVADETTPWGSTGVKAYWAAEADQMSPSELETKGKQMKLNKLFAFVLASEELLGDAPRLNARLTRQAGRAIDWKASGAVVGGSGAGQPLGWNNSAALVTVAKESAQAAATVVADNVAKMYARCIDPSRAFWLANQDVLPELLTMTIGDRPIWVPPSQGFAAAPGGILLGRPVRLTDHCETLGTAGDIELVNPDGYYAVNKAGGVSFAASIHLYFDYDLQAFRWTFRIGGQPYLSAPVSPNKGSATRSHFVRLATRA